LVEKLSCRFVDHGAHCSRELAFLPLSKLLQLLQVERDISWLLSGLLRLSSIGIIMPVRTCPTVYHVDVVARGVTDRLGIGFVCGLFFKAFFRYLLWVVILHLERLFLIHELLR